MTKACPVTHGKNGLSKKIGNPLIAIEAIASRIALVRGQKVMLDADLAALYGTTTKRLNEPGAA